MAEVGFRITRRHIAGIHTELEQGAIQSCGKINSYPRLKTLRCFSIGVAFGQCMRITLLHTCVCIYMYVAQNTRVPSHFVQLFQWLSRLLAKRTSLVTEMEFYGLRIDACASRQRMSESLCTPRVCIRV